MGNSFGPMYQIYAIAVSIVLLGLISSAFERSPFSPRLIMRDEHDAKKNRSKSQVWCPFCLFR